VSSISFLPGIAASAQGLKAQRMRMDLIAENIANATTTRTSSGGPYKRKELLLKAISPRVSGAAAGEVSLPHRVELAVTSPGHLRPGEKPLVGPGSPEQPRLEMKVAEREAFKLVYDPSHPDANADGYVLMPDINIIEEMVDMVAATRAYEANVNALSMAKQIAMKTLDLGK